MIRIAFAVYRQWGYDIFRNILAFQRKTQSFSLDTLILSNNYQAKLIPDSGYKEYIVDPTDAEKIFTICKERNIDIICFYSWSFLVDKKILDDFICLCLHPSKLPKYRGGTPLQHQILNNEKQSAVTIFKMSQDIDAGDIYLQQEMSLRGDINNIFSRMITIGTDITKHLIRDATHNKLLFTPQKNLERFPPNKRRTPQQSQIDLDHVKYMKYTDMYNLVRGLLDPYPNAFIQGKDFLMYITKIKYVPKVRRNALCIKPHSTLAAISSAKNWYLPLEKGFAKIVSYKIENLNL